MILKKGNIELTCLEIDIVEQRLDLDGKHILELGCGQGDLTRRIAGQGNDRRLVATEVDEQQHAINITNNKLPNVRFELAGAQAIPASDETFDRVLMFKSLHHVPVGVIQAALLEIKRVLKPGGLLYISEPLFQGDFNEVYGFFMTKNGSAQRHLMRLLLLCGRAISRYRNSCFLDHLFSCPLFQCLSNLLLMSPIPIIR